ENGENTFIQGNIHHVVGLITRWRDARSFEPLTLHHEHQGPDRAVKTSNGVTNWGSSSTCRTIRFTSNVAQPSERLCSRPKSGTISVRTCLAITGNPHENNIRIDGGQFVRTDAPAFESTWTKILDNNIRRGGQL